MIRFIISIGGKEVEVSREEALELFSELRQLFDTQEIKVTYPQCPYPICPYNSNPWTSDPWYPTTWTEDSVGTDIGAGIEYVYMQ